MPIDRRTDLDPNYQRSYTGVGGDQNDAVGRAQKLLGMHERAQNAMLTDYLHNGGQNLNPAQLAWCASFVNATLAQAGQKGTGSAIATSFMNWGQPVAANGLQRNDVVVFPRGRQAGQTGGHVGIATGNVRNGMLEVISGNHGDRVARTWEPMSSAMIRRGSVTAPVPVTPAVASATTPATQTAVTPAAPTQTTPGAEAPAADPVPIDFAPPPPPEEDAPDPYEPVAIAAGGGEMPFGGDMPDTASMPVDFGGMGEQPDPSSMLVAQKAMMGKQRMAQLPEMQVDRYEPVVVGQAAKMPQFRVTKNG